MAEPVMVGNAYRVARISLPERIGVWRRTSDNLAIHVIRPTRSWLSAARVSALTAVARGSSWVVSTVRRRFACSNGAAQRKRTCNSLRVPYIIVLMGRETLFWPAPTLGANATAKNRGQTVQKLKVDCVLDPSQ